MKLDNRLFKHIYRFLSGENDRTGKSIVDRWYNSLDDSRGFFDENRSSEKNEHQEKIFRNIEEDLHERKIQKAEVSRKRGNSYLWPTLGIAAILLIGVLSSLFVLDWPASNWFDANDENLTTISTDTGEVLEIELPDGSTVWLSTESRIQYPETFNRDERGVILEGEAFFDVIHNPEKPFVVRSGDVQSLVLGTSFTVKSYPGEPTKITLATGKVSVSAIGDSHETVLTKNQQVFYSKKNGFSDLKSVDASLEQAWINKELIFMRKSFLDIARTFERWHDVEFIFEDESLKEEVFVYHFTEYSLDESMKILNRMADFNYEILNNRVIIDSKI